MPHCYHNSPTLCWFHPYVNPQSYINRQTNHSFSPLNMVSTPRSYKLINHCQYIIQYISICHLLKAILKKLY